MARTLTSIEFCAGAGGQALGLERAGFRHKLLVDNDEHCINTLTENRPRWNAILADMHDISAKHHRGIDLFAAGLPCPPFSVAGKQLGEKDERNLFPQALRLIKETDPKFVLIENVRGFLGPVFQDYRETLKREFQSLGYHVDWRLLHSSDYGVSQLRPRVAIVAAKENYWRNFAFPMPHKKKAEPVGRLLFDLMKENGWNGADEWASNASAIAPTIVGGSKKHGGPDLGPTRAKKAWLELGVNGMTIAEEAPEKGFNGNPRLTVKMVAKIQGFPDTWAFTGRKTNAYRQVGNAFPPPVAFALGKSIKKAIYETEKQITPTMKVAAE